MPNLDDGQFETYLRKFRPLAPAPLARHRLGKTPATPRRRRVAIAVALLAAAAVIFALVLHIRANGVGVRSSNGATKTAVMGRPANSQPLTLGAADRILVNSPSFAAALDRVASEPDTATVPKTKESALAVLSAQEINP